MLLEAPQGMFRRPEDAKEFLDAFNSKHEGLDNSGKAGLLREGMKATVMPMTSADSQFLQQRNFQREEIALLFGLESILGDNTGAVYKSVSERNTAYIDNCLNRWLAKWQQEIDCKLLPYGNLESQFDVRELMNGDPNAIADYTNKLAMQGTNTINELRALHGFTPIEGGEEIAYANRGAEQEATPDGENPDDNNNEEPTEDKDDNNEA
jgi:HK97 family phage portal protein